MITELERKKAELDKLRSAQTTLADEVKDLERKERERQREPLKALTKKAHDCLCRWNHTDGCGWGYEEGQSGKEDNWDGWAHKRWLDHIEKIVHPDSYSKDKPIPISTIDRLLDWVIQVRKEIPDALWLIRHVLEPK